MEGINKQWGDEEKFLYHPHEDGLGSRRDFECSVFSACAYLDGHLTDREYEEYADTTSWCQRAVNAD